MSFRTQTDFYLEVAKGNIPGHSLIHKFGYNPDIDGAFEAIWNGGGSYTGHNPSGAEIIEIFSSDVADVDSGAGAHTVELFGLDASYVEQTEIVALSGLTSVDTVNSYLRMDRMIVRSAGSGAQNMGEITARQKNTTANIFCIMPIEYNQTMIAAYTIPSGKIAFLLSWFAGLSGPTGADCSVRLRMRPSGEVFQVKEQVAIKAAGSSHIQRDYITPKGVLFMGGITAQTDIFIESDTDTPNTAMSAGFDLVLIDD